MDSYGRNSCCKEDSISATASARAAKDCAPSLLTLDSAAHKRVMWQSHLLESHSLQDALHACSLVLAPGSGSSQQLAEDMYAQP